MTQQEWNQKRSEDGGMVRGVGGRIEGGAVDGEEGGINHCCLC